ncbi:N-acetylmuramoyl-L-alanine amidase [Oceanobacillus sp. E9]|uniref:N-acetylmuramoyl-L-alanine amidase n=1 Tax=Oceanobacillus TaxID=182709 RepID=UPI00084EA822|nr:MULTISPECIES: N-acetylmuramoyl-L-alanine amidase [Oceanobacillus]OEH56154.1 N-acetylmuramoyl-L-alanine amidase [Oceanobacillus sp. E9]
MKLYLDPGHGGSDPGATGNGLQEKTITLDIAIRIRDILLSNYHNVSVRMSRTADSTKSLAQRTNEANNWDADYFLSIHCNAFNGSAYGYEDFIHNSLSDQSITARYQTIIHEEVSKVNQLRNRGKKKANFHVLRESHMPALLTENGFIDHSGDAEKLRDPSWRQNVAQGHVYGLARAFQLQLKDNTPDPSPSNFFKVIAGSFRQRNNAEERVNLLSDENIEAIIVPVTISGQQWYRVQSGAFRNRDNANARVLQLQELGIEAFIITE